MKLNKRTLECLNFVSSVSLCIVIVGCSKKADLESQQENDATSKHISDIKREKHNSVEISKRNIERRMSIPNRKNTLSIETKDKISKMVRDLDLLAEKTPSGSGKMGEKYRALDEKVFRNFRVDDTEKGLVSIELIKNIYTMKSDDAKSFCLSKAGILGDERCVEPLKQLLASKNNILPSSSRFMAYSYIARRGGPDQIDYLRSQYMRCKLYGDRYILASYLARYGDATGALTLVEALEKNEGKEEICEEIQKKLINIYSVDLGNDIDAWKKVIKKGSPIIGSGQTQNSLP